MSTPITCLILAYNEAARIHLAVRHAICWADEVLVIDKSSTDATRSIAEKLGARVVTIPFSKQGHESYPEMVRHASHDWIWGFTAGEVPTRKCIEVGRAILREDAETVDLICVPMHYFSFGIHSAKSPWAGGWQPRLYHRHRVTFTGLVHDPIRGLRTARIDHAPGIHVLHQTHAAAESFIGSHADYAIAEAAPGDAHDRLRHAFFQIQAYDEAFNADPALLGQQIGWKLYWLMVALHAWQRINPGISAAYSSRAENVLVSEWLTSPPPA